jgi:hypothetical protein
VTCPPVPHRLRPRSAGSVLGVAALAVLSACYDGDFFDRLVDRDVVAAFRITTLTLIDPHFYGGESACQDLTNDYNTLWTAHLDAFEINPTLVLSPLDPAVEATTKMQIVPAQCVPGGEEVNCTDRDVAPEKIVEVMFNNSLQGGMCGGPVTGSLNTLYMSEVYEQLNAPQSPCFTSALIGSLKLPLGPTLELPLSNVQISAAYALEPETDQQLVQGVLFGFLPAAQGVSVLGTLNNRDFLPWSVIAGVGTSACQPDPMMLVDDLDTVSVDHDGVWMYFNFTAERVAWTPVTPDVDPPL